MNAATVEAAGGVVVRGEGEPLELAVVHRPRYDDWSLPKGKLESGERWEDAALREVEEETGLRCELGDELESARYRDRKGRDKLVRWWLMRPFEGAVRAQRRGRRAALAERRRGARAAGLRARPRSRPFGRRANLIDR